MPRVYKPMDKIISEVSTEAKVKGVPDIVIEEASRLTKAYLGDVGGNRRCMFIAMLYYVYRKFGFSIPNKDDFARSFNTTDTTLLRYVRMVEG